jgi:hypothetical protein
MAIPCVDRFSTVRFPFSYKKYSKKILFILTFLVWLIPLFLSLPILSQILFSEKNQYTLLLYTFTHTPTHSYTHVIIHTYVYSHIHIHIRMHTMILYVQLPYTVPTDDSLAGYLVKVGRWNKTLIGMPDNNKDISCFHN